jgi:hypothetical protein
MKKVKTCQFGSLKWVLGAHQYVTLQIQNWMKKSQNMSIWLTKMGFGCSSVCDAAE